LYIIIPVTVIDVYCKMNALLYSTKIVGYNRAKGEPW